MKHQCKEVNKMEYLSILCAGGAGSDWQRGTRKARQKSKIVFEIAAQMCFDYSAVCTLLSTNSLENKKFRPWRQQLGASQLCVERGRNPIKFVFLFQIQVNKETMNFDDLAPHTRTHTYPHTHTERERELEGERERKKDIIALMAFGGTTITARSFFFSLSHSLTRFCM
jgi:hypothetical protein